GLVGGVLVVSVAAQHLGAILLDVSPVCVTLAGSYALGLVRRIDQQSLSLVTQALRVRTTEARMRHVVENSSDAIVTVSQTGRVETFNPAAERLFGLPASEAIGAKLESLVPEGIAPNGAEAPPRREVLARRRDGSSFTAELSVTSFTLEGRALDVAFLRDITDQKAQQWALEHQATHDVLTDLPNRLMLQRRAEVCLESARREESPSAFLILDLDRFKEVNDTLGHHTGDRLLQMISRRLTEPLRPEETIARTGGDEFAVIIPGAGLAEARASAERLVEALEEPFDLDGLRLLVETSIGIALFPDHGTDPATLLRRGDVAMYQAKKRRNAIAVYDPLQDLNSVRHLTLRGELREAIEKDQLVLHYQPKVSGRTGCVEGVEALVRWRHPKHGLLPPAEFIPLAESTGLMREVTAWVLDSAFAQWARWDKEGLSLSLAVNCSARNLLEEDLPALMDSGLRARGMPASRLVVELTETAIIEDPGRSLKALDALATLGVRLSIDDFGTGYSSLEQLRRLPARELKIDKSFVARMDEDEGNIVIVRSTIDLAHNLGLEAVAEGVCSEAVWRRLRDLGCDLGQGFHLGRPMPAHAVAPWIAARGSGEMPGELIRPSAG
ncbi:MAG TPA: EAL domain-containing protein, partial [Candidatus Polarisedimenticolia bacterium]|nr:EAL domain-containing protein [Candidatus Polarisedimenticolia bacterium]